MNYSTEDLGKKTISDFGEQWTQFPENEGLYASVETFQDICGPLLSASEIQDKSVAEIGSGTGRIVNMLASIGVKNITAIEPSKAFEVLQKNVSSHLNVRCLQGSGDEIPLGDFDLVFSIGVLHHIPEPDEVVKAVHRSLKSGGKFLAWVYGREGNELYLKLVTPIREFTARLPFRKLDFLCGILNSLLDFYILACYILPLPMSSYMKNVIGKWTRKVRQLTIYDQLNPAYAKYYTQSEARELFEGNGFTDVRLFHRHEYSWTIIGTKMDAV